jgi:DNA polymerase III alpha subunit
MAKKRQRMYTFPCGCEWPIVGDPPSPGALPLVDIDDEELPFCSAVWELMAKGATKGVFQLETNLGQSWTKKLKPETAEHVGALGAILRPGCLKSKSEDGVSATERYVRRKNGEEQTQPIHPAVDTILAPTYGVLVYQEQAMLLARAVAGFSLQEADMLRKAIGKKLPEEMAKCKRMFMEGSEKAGVITQELAAHLFDWIEKSQRYSFNKSHAISYGLLGYDTAYAKAHLPVWFFANWLAWAKDKSDPMTEISELVEDAKLFDVPVLVPDLRMMEPHFSSDGVSVYFGLSDVRGIGVNQVGKLKAVIEQGEQATGRKLADWSWEDFLFYASSNITSSVVKALISVGALRWTKKTRTRMLNEFEKWNSLTEKEQEFAIEVLKYLRRQIRDEDLIGGPLPEEPKTKDEAWLAANVTDWATLDKKKRTSRKTAIRNSYKKLVKQYEHKMGVLNAKRDGADLAAVLSIVAQMGTANAKRASAVKSFVALLDNPPATERDTPHWIAWVEEQYLGVPLSCSKVDACDTSQVNTSCKDFLAGKTGYMVLGVEIRNLREYKTKGGKNPGQKMAFMSVADQSCALQDVTVFPDVYKQNKSLLSEGNRVLVHGERDQNRDSLIVQAVWQM